RARSGPQLLEGIAAEACERSLAGAVVSEPQRRGVLAAQFLEDGVRLGPQGRPAEEAQAAYAASQLCDAPARSRRRSAVRADDVGPFRYRDDADLYARRRGTFETGVPGASSARLMDDQGE